jgi:putative DNA primase/helicase
VIEISQYSKEIAIALLGEENKRLSKGHELRYGNNGSLSVNLVKGTWFDHETEEGGGMVSLIQKHHGSDVSQFLRSIGVEDLKPVVVNGGDSKPVKSYSNTEMHQMAKDAELVSRYSEDFCVMRFTGKVIRPFSRLVDGTWRMKRPQGLLPLMFSSEGDKDLPALIVEGESAFGGAKSLYDGIVVTWHGGTGSWKNQDWTQLSEFSEVLIWPDKDEPGFKCANEIKEHLKQLGMVVKIINPPKHFNDKDDLMDAFERGEQLNILEYAKDNEYDVGKRVVFHAYGKFKDKDYPEMVWMMDNLMARGHLAMIHGSPGHGKSLLTQIMAVCLAAGYDFGHYPVTKPQKVMLVDAEMPPVSLQQRFADMMILFDGEIQKEELIKRVNQNLIIISHHDQAEGLTPLNTNDGKEWFYNAIDDIDPDFIILDNLLTLMQFDDANSSEEWVREVNPLLLKMRQQDRSVWFVHHSGKSGKQLGSMAKEVILDCVIRIELQGIDEDDDESILGLDTNLHESKFKWTFEKTRHFYGQHAYPVLWKYSNGILTKDKTAKESRVEMVAQMKNEGLSNRQIAKELKVSPGTVDNDVKTAKSLDIYSDQPEF